MTENKSYLMSIFGTPSALTRWIINVSTAIARNVSPDYNFIAASSLDDLRTAWSTKKPGSVIFHSDCPRQEITNIFTGKNYPLVLVSEPLWRVVCYAAIARDLDPILSVRITTQSVATLSVLQRCHYVFRVSEENYLDSAIDLIGRLLRFYGIDAPLDAFPGILHEMQISPSSDTTVEESLHFHFPEYKSERLYPRSLLSEDAKFIIDQYEDILRGLSPSDLSWPPSVCYRFQPEIAYLDGPLEMTGEARVLIGGHALCLPPGQWRARVLLDVADNGSGNKMLSDVFTEDEVAFTVLADIPKSGTFYYDLDFVCSDPFYPIIIRIAILEGAIEGVLTLRDISLKRLG